MRSELASEFRALAAALRLFPRLPPADADALLQSRRNNALWTRQHALTVDPRVVVKRNAIFAYVVYRPPVVDEECHVFYIHGGGLVYNSVEDYAGIMSCWALHSRCSVTAFSYLPAPEYAMDETFAQLRAAIGHRLRVAGKSKRLVIAGDSIGGYMALALAVGAFARRFVKLVLIYPVLDLHDQRPSYREYGRGYLLDASMMTWFQRLARSERELAEFRPFDLTYNELHSLPVVDVYSSEFDVLRDDAQGWVQYLRGLDIPVRHEHFEALPHNFCLYAGTIPAARAALLRIGTSFDGV